MRTISMEQLQDFARVVCKPKTIDHSQAGLPLFKRWGGFNLTGHGIFAHQHLRPAVHKEMSDGAIYETSYYKFDVRHGDMINYVSMSGGSRAVFRARRIFINDPAPCDGLEIDILLFEPSSNLTRAMEEAGLEF